MTRNHNNHFDFLIDIANLHRAVEFHCATHEEPNLDALNLYQHDLEKLLTNVQMENNIIIYTKTAEMLVTVRELMHHTWPDPVGMDKLLQVIIERTTHMISTMEREKNNNKKLKNKHIITHQDMEQVVKTLSVWKSKRQTYQQCSNQENDKEESIFK